MLPSNGLRIAVSVHQPSQPNGTAVIICPGFLDSRQYPHMVNQAEGFAAAGCVAARLDTAGIWDSEGAEADYSITRYLRDIAAVEAYLRSNYNVTRLLVAGHSMGGFVSLLYAAAGDVQGVIALCSPKQMLGTSKPDWRKKKLRTANRDLPDGTGQRIYQVPWSFAVDSSQYSALDAVRSYDGLPVFFMAAGKDAVVPPDEVADIYTAAHEPKKLIVFDEMEHDIRKDARDSAIVTTAAVEWARQQGLLPTLV